MFQGKKRIWRSRRKWDDNIKMEIMKPGTGIVELDNWAKCTFQ